MMVNRRILIFLIIFIVIKRFMPADILDFDAFNGGGKFISAKGGIITSDNNELWDDLDIELNTISPKEGTIEKYDDNTYHLELSLKQGLKSLNGLSFSLVENWSLYENQDRFKFRCSGVVRVCLETTVRRLSGLVV